MLVLGGEWSAYWYNGYIYGSEIARGLVHRSITVASKLNNFVFETELVSPAAVFSVMAQERIKKLTI